ncbi:glycoside hydrolase family 15 protein [Arthrobacter sp. H5]|uniref:glycoside hydrolase family 15 protein n=1 Tax=Arthrobacter sp. H5 TaxID=1267973 RepID=UPI0004885776|nr:glycoside hydrolase family 15 protein [Arthrobacter sp. H5]
MSTRGQGDYADLRSYAAIGDGRTVALIALDGGIDWFPIPALDSTPVFARLVDAKEGGSIELAPVGDFTVTRRYAHGTNVLETTFTTDSGVARVTDALVTGFAGQLPWVELARRIDGIDGVVRFRWRVTPGTCLSVASPWVDTTIHGKVIRVGGLTLAVRGLAHGPQEGGNRALAGSFTTAAKSRHLITVAGTATEPVHVPVPELTDEGVNRTIEKWRSWSDDFNYDGPWADAVQRSALALKLLIYSPTGAIAAAATTSLPENLRGGKNWDYRFAWVRDAAYTVRSLVRFGLREETHAAVAWLLRTIKECGPELHIFYTLDGTVPSGVETREVPGWRGIGPVTIGNRAANQLQLGVYGDLFNVMRVYVEAGNVLDVDTGLLLASLADHVTGIWRQPDAGMWELPEQRHYTSSKMGCWQALTDATRLCEMGQIPGNSAHWQSETELIAAWVRENCWSETRKSFVGWAGGDDLDASVLLHAQSGFDRGSRMSSTIDAIRAELGDGSLTYRYTGAAHEEGAFVACSFWLASALACVGRDDESVALMNELVGLANDVGLYSEMIDPSDKAFLGNLPQGLSHLALINAAITIEELTRE